MISSLEESHKNSTKNSYELYLQIPGLLLYYAYLILSTYLCIYLKKYLIVSDMMLIIT